MKHQNKMMMIIFWICLVLSMFSSVARADDTQVTAKLQTEEMTQEDQEILSAMNDEFSVTLKPQVQN